MKFKSFSLAVIPAVFLLLTWFAGLNSAEARIVSADISPIEPERVLSTPAVSASATITLYDGALGGTPDSQSFLYLNFPLFTATNTESGGVTTLDTTIVDMNAYAGYFGDHVLTPDIPVLERTSGYTLTFTIQIETESHGNDSRAGFSVIVLSEDQIGIEMAFWDDEIWVQDDDAVDPGNLFTHAEGAVYSTTAALESYHLAIFSDTYTLTVGASTILSGRLRDYTNFSGPIDPYETPNFIFLGDNTTSAMGRTRLSFVAVTLADPNPPPPLDNLVFMPVVQQP